jgi:hypothetical protein
MRKIFLTVIIAVACMARASYGQEVKESDLSGSWYPASKAELERMLNGYLGQARPEKIVGDLLVIISPHAGYQFSAPVAAYGFKLVEDRPFKTVIVLGFSHRRHFAGIAVYDRGLFRTPLGDVQIDAELAKSIISQNAKIRFNPALFEGENSVELQIPFVQTVLKNAKIVPIAFGTQDYQDAETLAQALAAVVKDRRDVLIVHRHVPLPSI